MPDNSYTFDLPGHHKSIIKVIGVGGGGSNAVNFMYNQGIKDVEFVVCNTDAQALKCSPVPTKLQIGSELTSGLGAGANPEKGRDAAIESKEQIIELLSDGTKMVFITAGMGGGTGTGAAPVIAKIAKEMGILTVGIVTSPFQFEGPRKRKQADVGIDEMKANSDTVLVILNDKVRAMFGNLTVSQAFWQADTILTTAAKGIAEIITLPGYINVDFNDVQTVMKDSGTSVMGSSQSMGENRAIRAAQEAISSPLLNNREIHGAQKILLSVVSGDEAELTMDEFSDITEYIQQKSGDEAEIIFGHSFDSSLGENIRVTVIATGFDKVPANIQPIFEEEIEEKKVYDLDKPLVPPVTIDFNIESKQTFSPVASSAYQSQPIKTTVEQVEPVNKDEKVIYDLEGTLVSNPKPIQNNDHAVRVENIDENAEAARLKKQYIEEAEERKRKLRSLGKSALDTDLRVLDIPAFQRKSVDLKEVSHSTERNISRYNLTDDNEILGNNKFLHDNVD